jgi:RimK family alpha-L-glutamate ligase
MPRDESARSTGGAIRVAVVGTSANESNALLVAAWRSLGLDCELLSGTQALNAASELDVAVGRLDVLPSLDGIEPGLVELRRLEGLGVRVLNRALPLVTVHDKLETAQCLRAADIPHPVTVHVTEATVSKLPPPPLVLKPRHGSWGEDVRLCSTADDVRRTLDELAGREWFRKHGVLAQQVVPSSGHDVRIVVAAGSVIGAVERVAAPGEWRTNVSTGGTKRPITPPPAARALALAAAHVSGTDLVGVDLLPLPTGGFVVLELNGAVEFDHTYSLAGVDPYAAAAEGLGLAVPAAAR